IGRHLPAEDRPTRRALDRARRLHRAGEMMASGTHAQKLFSRPARLAAIAPYVWMALFFLVPFIFVLKISLSQTAVAQPPYVPVFDVGDPGAMPRALAKLSSDNFKLLVSDSSMSLGIFYSYCPFMILPLYATLVKQDLTLLEAAADLGCSRRQAFWLVTFPLSLPGVAAGALLCFIPIVGEFVIPDLLAGSGSLMIGQTLWLEFFTNKDWPVASAAGVVLLLMLLLPLVLFV